MDYTPNFFLDAYNNGGTGIQSDALVDERLQYDESTTDPDLRNLSEDPMSFLKDLDPAEPPSFIIPKIDNLEESEILQVEEIVQLDSPQLYDVDLSIVPDPALDTDLEPSAHLPEMFLEESRLWIDPVNCQLTDEHQLEKAPLFEVVENGEHEKLVGSSPFEIPHVTQMWLTTEEIVAQPVQPDQQYSVLPLGMSQVISPPFAENPTGPGEALLDMRNIWLWFTPEGSSSKSQIAPQTIIEEVEEEKVLQPNIDKNPSIKLESCSNKPDRRKPKPIAGRFRTFGYVSVMPSYVQCLNVVLDYKGYTGNIRQIILNDSITNVAMQAHDVNHQKRLILKRLDEVYYPKEREALFGNVPGAPDNEERTLSVISGILQRKIHVREINEIVNAVSLLAYVKSGRFNINSPYEPQYYRYELDDRGRVVNESKCGMCAFCPSVKFLPFKNSSYLSHMTLEHGIFASNYVVPEGLYYGRYRMYRSNDPLKTRTVKALQCPACFQVIEVACWKNKSNPLLSYFRHFKKIHLNLNKTFTSSTIDPVLLKHQGGDMFQDQMN